MTPRPRFRTLERNQIQLLAESLDMLLDPRHEVRDLWAYVSALDLSAVTGAVKSVHGTAGAPVYDPAVLLALWLYATARGIGSCRELELACEENMPFRWLCGGDAPGYHTLSDFRAAAGPLLDNLLTQSLAILTSEGLIEPEEMTVAHDSLRVRAAAGRGSFRRLPTLAEALREAKDRVLALKEQLSSEPVSARQAAARIRAAREREDRVARALEICTEQAAKPRKKDRPAPRVSTTDPEAPRAKMASGGIDPAHSFHLTADTKTLIITAVSAAPDGSDYGQLTPAVLQHERRLKNKPVRILADAGFADDGDLIALAGAGVEALVARGKKKPREIEDRQEITGWIARMEDLEKLDLYRKKRPATIECVNAQLRSRGLTRITVRGRENALNTAFLHAVFHNIHHTGRLRKLHADRLKNQSAARAAA